MSNSQLHYKWCEYSDVISAFNARGFKKLAIPSKLSYGSFGLDHRHIIISCYMPRPMV